MYLENINNVKSALHQRLLGDFERTVALRTQVARIARHGEVGLHALPFDARAAQRLENDLAVGEFAAARQSPIAEKREQAAARGLADLSPRELDILRGIARGDSNKAIARDLGIAETTVKIHVQHVLRKLNVASRVHAAVIASAQLPF